MDQNILDLDVINDYLCNNFTNNFFFDLLETN